MAMDTHPHRRRCRSKGVRHTTTPEIVDELATASYVSLIELASMARKSDRALWALLRRVLVHDLEP